ncbi:MAG: Transcriptional repressor NrdR [Candidatus Magasanikbacteria bacterium GW2011_GWD2_43_18]|uniref:Transcriptional repressor NrdR n=1 Tax=Candidatus Magasanikbacteria bacterium GW2011_GWE2_42_7 TaxID=1619052 RepID=A0A0G1BFC6_9BACT|nr:MAG: Transcriptional repressor NrdR [Candidatus Magasanikbacteria bacterium GW2011_GWC2_42_27]KKS72002.1 MAG: Transcriptional repressor NrdR [Candidatus Magasanikbacteria bacterium GW2011_GWE2_42_7]KKT04841.1 MAG: Transcriptional repressor NrdR [Candidatus Magasanikbacteria bacterium GW2011_GWD2_43_18]KKT25217.1 MAG: Transcriptional repressor NrdR [Candidatus Magasanikbacteria bacterium GW2011_GWA2_43_9]HBB37543.1 transcriptional regulator NrdR [Candidatus Magasanikbacteria bacterium]
MYCPVCRSKETKVIDSRVAEAGMSIRRRRECTKCHYRFSTLEETELLDLVVVKQRGSRESYERSKLEKGLVHSLTKRPYTQEAFRAMVNEIERDIQKKAAKTWSEHSTKYKEITSEQIGEIVMKHLKKFDKVAYIRFASIYRAFEDVETFQHELKTLTKRRTQQDPPA